MFNKDGIPLFTIMIPFLCIIFVAFFSTSYYLKLSNEKLVLELQEYKVNYTNKDTLNQIIAQKTKEYKQSEDKFIRFVSVLTLCVLIFMSAFSYLMVSIVYDVVKKYKEQVQNKEEKLQTLNQTLSHKVKEGVEDGKKKDKAILQQSKLARMGSMISMIAHQWRQPLTELSGILMELETATRFKKVDEKHLLKSIEKSDKMIEFMSNTIDDFRNFYKPDKKKETFFVLDACNKAIYLVKASLSQSSIDFQINVENDKQIFGYPTEYSQVILNLISNAKDVLIEKNISNPKIILSIQTRGLLSIVTVQDNAGGIKEENFDLIFDPYFSTKDSSKGTGLGLYISKLIIERNMGGELSVENDENGAIFQIMIAG